MILNDGSPPSIPSKSDNVIEKINSKLMNITDMYNDAFGTSIDHANNHNETDRIVKRNALYNEYEFSLNSADETFNHLPPSQHAQRRAGPEIADSIEIRQYRFPFIISARIGPYTFS